MEKFNSRVKKSRVKKGLACFMTVLFLLNNCWLAQAAEKNFWEERQNALGAHKNESMPLIASLPINNRGAFPQPWSPLPPVSVSPLKGRGISLWQTQPSWYQEIPLAYGRVQEVFTDKAFDQNQSPVIIIQDVHMNVEAQENIARILESLIQQKKVGGIGVEGAFGPFDFSRFYVYPGQIRQNVASYYLRKKIISAPSYVGLAGSAETPPMVGIDDLNHYRENLRAYLVSSRLKEAQGRALQQKKTKLFDLKRKTFSSDLLAFDQNQEQFREGRLGLGDFASSLLSKLKSLKKYDPLEFPTLELFVDAVGMERAMDFPRVTAEREHVLKKVTGQLNEKSVKELLSMSLSLQAEEIEFSMFYRYLDNLLSRHHVQLEDTPHFRDYIRYVLLADSLDATRLFAEVERARETLTRLLCQTPQDITLMEESQALNLRGKLLDFSLTPEEWKKYKTLRHGACGMTHKKSSQASCPMQHNENLSSFERFYVEADIRSQKMLAHFLANSKFQTLNSKQTQKLKNLNSKINKSLEFKNSSLEFPKPKVLVVGGFHTQDITRQLRERNISYVVLQPKITKIDGASGSEYLSIFNQEKASLNELFQGEKLFLANLLQNVGAGVPGNAFRETEMATLMESLIQVGQNTPTEAQIEAALKAQPQSSMWNRIIEGIGSIKKGVIQRFEAYFRVSPVIARAVFFISQKQNGTLSPISAKFYQWSKNPKVLTGLGLIFLAVIGDPTAAFLGAFAVGSFEYVNQPIGNLEDETRLDEVIKSIAIVRSKSSKEEEFEHAVERLLLFLKEAHSRFVGNTGIISKLSQEWENATGNDRKYIAHKIYELSSQLVRYLYPIIKNETRKDQSSSVTGGEPVIYSQYVGRFLLKWIGCHPLEEDRPWGVQEALSHIYHEFFRESKSKTRGKKSPDILMAKVVEGIRNSFIGFDPLIWDIQFDANRNLARVLVTWERGKRDVNDGTQLFREYIIDLETGFILDEDAIEVSFDKNTSILSAYFDGNSIILVDDQGKEASSSKEIKKFRTMSQLYVKSQSSETDLEILKKEMEQNVKNSADWREHTSEYPRLFIVNGINFRRTVNLFEESGLYLGTYALATVPSETYIHGVTGVRFFPADHPRARAFNSVMHEIKGADLALAYGIPRIDRLDWRKLKSLRESHWVNHLGYFVSEHILSGQKSYADPILDFGDYLRYAHNPKSPYIPNLNPNIIQSTLAWLWEYVWQKKNPGKEISNLDRIMISTRWAPWESWGGTVFAGTVAALNHLAQLPSSVLYGTPVILGLILGILHVFGTYELKGTPRILARVSGRRTLFYSLLKGICWAVWFSFVTYFFPWGNQQFASLSFPLIKFFLGAVGISSLIGFVPFIIHRTSNRQNIDDVWGIIAKEEGIDLNRNTKIAAFIGGPHVQGEYYYRLFQDTVQEFFGDQINLAYLPYGFDRTDTFWRSKLAFIKQAIRKNSRMMGAVITRPWKEFFSDVDVNKSRATSINYLVKRQKNQLEGSDVDTEGWLKGLNTDFGSTYDFRGKRVTILGTGGAAKMLVVALNGKGVGEVVLTDPDKGNLASMRALLRKVRPDFLFRIVDPDRAGKPSPELHAAIETSDLLVNATGVGRGSTRGRSPLVTTEGLQKVNVLSELISAGGTKLMEQAKEAKVPHIFSGRSMFIYGFVAFIKGWVEQMAPHLITEGFERQAFEVISKKLEFDDHLQRVVDFLGLKEFQAPPMNADLLVVLGTDNVALIESAKNMADRVGQVLVIGGQGWATQGLKDNALARGYEIRDLITGSEAPVMKRILITLGIMEGKIVALNTTTTTWENIESLIRYLKTTKAPQKIILMHSGVQLCRSWLHALHRIPEEFPEVKIYPYAPIPTVSKLGRPEKEALAKLALAEVEKIKSYGTQGFIDPTDFGAVQESLEFLKPMFGSKAPAQTQETGHVWQSLKRIFPVHVAQSVWMEAAFTSVYEMGRYFVLPFALVPLLIPSQGSHFVGFVVLGLLSLGFFLRKAFVDAHEVTDTWVRVMATSLTLFYGASVLLFSMDLNVVGSILAMTALGGHSVFDASRIKSKYEYIIFPVTPLGLEKIGGKVVENQMGLSADRKHLSVVEIVSEAGIKALENVLSSVKAEESLDKRNGFIVRVSVDLASEKGRLLRARVGALQQKYSDLIITVQMKEGPVGFVESIEWALREEPIKTKSFAEAFLTGSIMINVVAMSPDWGEDGEYINVNGNAVSVQSLRNKGQILLYLIDQVRNTFVLTPLIHEVSKTIQDLLKQFALSSQAA